jgi:hypothetical protein
MSKRDITCIDLSVLVEYQVTINECMSLIKIYRDDDFNFDDTGVDYEKLQTEKFIKIIKNQDENHYILRQKGNDFIESVIGHDITIKAAKKKKNKVNVDLITRLPEFRAQWKGLRPGSMGSLQSCKDKLTRWMAENPDYTMDEIIGAAEAYINSLNGDYRFLQRADYFIYKQENNREESSRLSAFIDEIGMNTSQGDWTTKLN